ncbi:MAG: TIGR01777 family oxidoreductase, partial [Calditrichia bacterium]
SAIGYYGSQKDRILDEESPAGDDFLAEVCKVWENSPAGVDDRGVRRVTVRQGLVLGPDGGMMPLIILPFRFFAGGKLGNGRQWFSWIHIADVIGAIQFLMERSELSGVFNLTAPAPVQARLFFDKIARHLHRPSWLNIPSPVLEIFGGEMARDTILASQRVLPRRLMDEGYSFKYSDLDEALTAIFKKMDNS